MGGVDAEMEMEGQAKTQARLGGLRVTVAIVLSIGIIALLGLVGNEAAPRMQSLLTAKNAAAISAHATYDSEQVTYGAQMRAMRHLKGELLSANADLSSFLVTGAKKKFDITRMIAMKELDQANHEAHALMLNAKSKLMNTAFTLENKKKRLTRRTPSFSMQSMPLRLPTATLPLLMAAAPRPRPAVERSLCSSRTDSDNLFTFSS